MFNSINAIPEIKVSRTLIEVLQILFTKEITTHRNKNGKITSISGQISIRFIDLSLLKNFISKKFDEEIAEQEINFLTLAFSEYEITPDKILFSWEENQ